MKKTQAKKICLENKLALTYVNFSFLISHLTYVVIVSRLWRQKESQALTDRSLKTDGQKEGGESKKGPMRQ